MPFCPRLASIPPAAVLALGVVTAAGCTSDLPAPGQYNVDLDTDSAGTTTGTSALMVDCSDPLVSAVDASFSFFVPAMGGDGFYTFSASNLPDGLAIDATTGEVNGVPTTEGDYTFDITVNDTSGNMGSTTCDLQVNPALTVDLQLDKVPYCAIAGESLLDFVVDGTGDGTAIVCDHPSGSGNGKRPAGISINADSCLVEGTIQDDRLGTWVFVVRGTQSGAEVWLPYCVTNDMPHDYEIVVTHSGSMADNTLVPLMRTFNPDAALDVGGGMDPLFEITDEDACAPNSCYYGFAFGINASPFDADTFSLAPTQLFNDMGNNPVGFTHEMSVQGPAVSEQFKTRPWVLNVDLDYCLSSSDTECEGVDNIQTNGDGNLEFGIIMVPQ